MIAMKRKNLQSVVALLIVSVLAISCNSSANTNANNASVEIDATESDVTKTTGFALVEAENDTYDFGVIEEGEKVTHEFVFTNTGTAPLIINSVRASCGCTTPNYPKEPIKPGEQSKIEVVFDSSNQPGMQHKVITMLSNTEESQTIFHLKGQVK